MRRSLAEIVLRRRPRLLVVSAPAGYGKSTFVRQFLAHTDDWTVCDCLGVTDDVDLAREVLRALASSRPVLANAISQAQLGISNDARDWAAVTCQFWMGDGPNVFVFENAEALTRSSGACALFKELMRRKDRTTIVCSREIVPVPYGRGFDPTNVLTLGADDLRFSFGEIRETLAGLSFAEQTEVERISRGWPIIVTLLGRAVEDKPFRDVVAGLVSVDHGELLEYLVSELLDGLSPAELHLAQILALVPDVTYTDIDRAWPAITSDDIDRLATRLPLFRSGEAIRLHPMLVQLLRKRAGPRAAQIVRDAADAARACDDDTRAAELYLSINDEFAAASVLRNLGAFIMATPTPRLAAVISRFSEKTLLKYPAVWCCALMHRGYAIAPFEWLRAAEVIWNELPADAEPDLRASVFSSLINGHTNIGLHAKAADLLHRYRRSLGDSDPCGAATLWSACLDSYDGRYDRIAEYTRALAPILNASELTHALYLYEVISPIPRSRGEWDRDAEILLRSRQLFDRAPQMGVSLLAIVESAFARWLAGDDEQCDAFVSELEGRVTVANERGHRFFIACLRGRAKTEAYGYEKTKTRAQGLLIASARAGTLADARSFARTAVDVADQCNRRYLRVLARCALAILDEDQRDSLLAQALDLSADLDSVPMRAAIAGMIERSADGGMLGPFVKRYAAFTAARTRLTVRALRGEILLGDAEVSLARSELALLIALAQAPRSYTISELGDVLFPELDGDHASNRLHVYIHRLRQRLGRDVVIADEKGYRLNGAVDVDLWRLRAIVAKKRRGTAPSHAETAGFAAYEAMSPAEFDSLALRLRLPEVLVNVMRENFAQVSLLREHLAWVNDAPATTGEATARAEPKPMT